VTGKRLAFAQKLLLQHHCGVGRITYASSRKVAKGRVISQGRKPFLTLRENTKINLVVSRGR
jgi:beta-lactam-binding protein with PASTA domain